MKVFTCPSIYGRLSDKKIDWGIYGYNRDPLTRLDYTDTMHADESHFGHFRDFQARAAAGTLPAYSFLEPSFGAGGNSQHPNYDVALGEQLIHDVYYTVRNSPNWHETLLVSTTTSTAEITTTSRRRRGRCRRTIQSASSVSTSRALGFAFRLC